MRSVILFFAVLNLAFVAGGFYLATQGYVLNGAIALFNLAVAAYCFSVWKDLA